MDESEAQIPCPECGKSFKTDRNLQCHISAVHRISLSNCDKCGKGFKNPDYLRNHVNKVHNVENIICDVCTKICKSKGNLYNHKRDVHELIQNLNCDLCGELQKNYSYLSRHKRRFCKFKSVYNSGKVKNIIKKEQTSNNADQIIENHKPNDTEEKKLTSKIVEDKNSTKADFNEENDMNRDEISTPDVTSQTLNDSTEFEQEINTIIKNSKNIFSTNTEIQSKNVLENDQNFKAENIREEKEEHNDDLRKESFPIKNEETGETENEVSAIDADTEKSTSNLSQDEGSQADSEEHLNNSFEDENSQTDKFIEEQLDSSIEDEHSQTDKFTEEDLDNFIEDENSQTEKFCEEDLDNSIEGENTHHDYLIKKENLHQVEKDNSHKDNMDEEGHIDVNKIMTQIDDKVIGLKDLTKSLEEPISRIEKSDNKSCHATEILTEDSPRSDQPGESEALAKKDIELEVNDDWEFCELEGDFSQITNSQITDFVIKTEKTIDRDEDSIKTIKQEIIDTIDVKDVKREKNPIDKRNEIGCFDCKEVFKSKNYLMTHIKIMHTKPEKTSCEVCNKEFKTYLLKKHIQDVHTIEVSNCDECGKIFNKRKNLRDHQRAIHKEADMISCEYCPKQFKVFQLKTHIKNVHTTVISPCDECGKIYNSIKRLTDHKRTVHINLEMFCDLCGKTFKCKSYLAIHTRRFHNAVDENLSCDQCDKIFKTKNDLYLHKSYVHTIENIPCSVCGKNSRNRYTMKKHMKHNHSNLEA